MQQHLKRAFILLFVAIVAFIIVRSLIVPESFGQYGWYRGNSVNELMSFNVTNANSTECADCHQSVYTVWANGSHNTINCDDCHGSTEDHANNNRIIPQPANDSKEFCGLCHFQNVARPKDFPQINPNSGHGEDLKCTYCHNPHKPWFV
jgi:hypothetical protein